MKNSDDRGTADTFENSMELSYKEETILKAYVLSLSGLNWDCGITFIEVSSWRIWEIQSQLKLPLEFEDSELFFSKVDEKLCKAAIDLHGFSTSGVQMQISNFFKT